MPRRPGGARKKRRTHKELPSVTSGPTDRTPRSFVFRRGNVPNGIRDLVPDIRTALMPNTAMRLKERKLNTIRDYVSIATQIGVTHFWIFSATSKGPYLRIARVPQGPTLSFRVVEYSLAADVRSSQRRPIVPQDRDFAHAPLLVMNNFVGGGHEVSLVAEMFRHSFPPIDVATTRLSSLRRVLLVHREDTSGYIYIRHYALKAQQAGLSRPIRKMVNKNRVPNMSSLADVSQLLDDSNPSATAGVFSSDSEAEENPDAVVTLPQPMQQLRSGAKSSIKLTEVGPRLTLELVKAQAGLCDGAVLYHRYVQKTEEQEREDERRIERRKSLKRKRQEEQEANVRRKAELKRAKKERRKRSVLSRISGQGSRAMVAQDYKSDDDTEGEKEYNGNAENVAEEVGNGIIS